MILPRSTLACTAVVAPTDLTSLAVPDSEPDSKITSFSQPHIVLVVMAWWGFLEESQKRCSDLDLSLLRILSSLTRWYTGHSLGSFRNGSILIGGTGL